MKKIRINSRERAWLADMARESLQLQENWPRRLRNALLSLSNTDPSWMIWVEREIDPDWSIPKITRLVEARARAFYLRPHAYFGRESIGWFLFCDTLVFTDLGNLKAG